MTTTLYTLSLIALILGLACAFALLVWKINDKKKTAAEDETTPDTPDTPDEPDTDDGEESSEDTSTDSEEEAKPCVCTEKGALEVATAADKKAEEARKLAAEANEKLLEMEHHKRLAANAEAIRMAEGVIVLKRTELTRLREALHFAKDTLAKLKNAFNAALADEVTAYAEQNSAASKHNQAVDAAAKARIAVANATLANAGAEVLDALSAKLFDAHAAVDAAFAELQAAIAAVNAANAAKDQADANVDRQNEEIEAIKVKISQLEDELEQLEEDLKELKA